MQFLILFLPMALAVNAAGLHCYFVDKKLLRIVRQRYSWALDAARARERRWYDGSEELVVGEKAFRRRLLEALRAPAEADAELGAVLQRAHSARRAFRQALIVSTAATAVLLIAARQLAGD